MNLLAKYEAKQIGKLPKTISTPEFRAGDTLKVHVRIVEGVTERIQIFEGICLRRKRRGIGSTFTVRKISNNEGVERTFLLHSPRVERVELLRKGKVRRAKLYYMRELKGKAARIQERKDNVQVKQSS